MDLTLPDGSYYYMRVDVGQTVYETWWATDDSGRIELLRGGNGYGLPQKGTVGPGEFYSDSGPVAYLSTDPAELEQQLRARVEEGGASPEPYADWGGPIEWGLIRSIRELLEAPDVTPAQKAALVQVAANLDGVDVEMDAQDPSGRNAILLTTDTEGQSHSWWFDPQVISCWLRATVSRSSVQASPMGPHRPCCPRPSSRPAIDPRRGQSSEVGGIGARAGRRRARSSLGPHGARGSAP
jgi:hypothetical protein